MNSKYQEVRNLLSILTEIKLRNDIRNNVPISPSIFLKSISSHTFYRDPSRYGFKYLSTEHIEVQRFLLTLSPHTFPYSPNYPHYLTHLKDGPILHLDIFDSLKLLFHSKEFSSEISNRNYIKCVHESGHILLSFFHPRSNCLFQSAYISSNTFILSECQYFIPTNLQNNNNNGWISICLGGLAAEYFVFGKVSPRGSDNDLKDILDEIHKYQLLDSSLLSRVESSDSFSEFKSKLSFLNQFHFIPSTSISNHFSSYYSQVRSIIDKYSNDKKFDKNSNKIQVSDAKSERMEISNEVIHIIQDEFTAALKVLEANKDNLFKLSEYIQKRMDSKVTREDIQNLLQLKNL